jgi:hypothetical protein
MPRPPTGTAPSLPRPTPSFGRRRAPFAPPRTKVGARRGSAKSSQMMSVSPATASECQAAGTKPVRHARYRHCEERGEETNPDATPGSPRAPARPRDGAWRFGAAASCAGAGLAGGQFIPGRRRLHLRGRADPPTRCADQAPKLKFPVLGGQAASGLQPSRLRFSGRDAPPTQPHQGRLASCALATATVTGWRESSRRRARAGAAARRLSRRGRSSRGARAAPGPRCSRWRWGGPPGAAARSAPGSPRKSRRCPLRSAAAPH